MLASSRVQLGEQMQIHELTRPRRVNEALGAVGSVLGGIASQVGNQAMTKALGTDVSPQYGAAQNREQGFQNLANSPAAKTLATTMQKAWQQTVQNFMANSKDSNGNPPMSLDKVTQPSIATLRANLEQLVNNMLGRGGVDYKALANSIADPNQKDYAGDIVADIDKSIDAIYQATLQNTDPKAVANLFTQLTGMGILPAQNILAYDTGVGSRLGTTSATRLSPQAQRVADQAKLTDADVLNLQQLAKNPANIPALMQMIGIKTA
jgi:hypothetical protein